MCAVTYCHRRGHLITCCLLPTVQSDKLLAVHMLFTITPESGGNEAAEQPLQHAEGVLRPAAAVSQSTAAWPCCWSQIQNCAHAIHNSQSPGAPASRIFCTRSLVMSDSRCLMASSSFGSVTSTWTQHAQHGTAQHAAAAQAKW